MYYVQIKILLFVNKFDVHSLDLWINTQSMFIYLYTRVNPFITILCFSYCISSYLIIPFKTSECKKAIKNIVLSIPLAPIIFIVNTCDVG